MSTIVSLEDFREQRNTLAYKWAVKEQKELNIPAPPVGIKFDSDRLTHDEGDYFVSIFYNKDDGKALLRRDWDNHTPSESTNHSPLNIQIQINYSATYMYV